MRQRYSTCSAGQQAALQPRPTASICFPSTAGPLALQQHLYGSRFRPLNAAGSRPGSGTPSNGASADAQRTARNPAASSSGDLRLDLWSSLLLASSQKIISSVMGGSDAVQSTLGKLQRYVQVRHT